MLLIHKEGEIFSYLPLNNISFIPINEYKTAISRLRYILWYAMKLNFFKFSKIDQSLSHGSLQHIWGNCIGVGYIGCWHQVASIHICIMYIRGAERGENTQKSQNTFSVILQIHPFCYRPDCMTWPTPKRISNMMWNSYDINGHKFSLKFLWSP